MTHTQQWRYLNLSKTVLHFPAKGIVTYMLSVHSPAEHFQTPGNKLNNVNVNYLNIPKKHRGPHKAPSLAAYLRTLAYTAYRPFNFLYIDS